ncbi:MAG: hypothetical protein RL637_1788 [Pseudomonadota bacterium]|jgi:hypothetical protein
MSFILYYIIETDSQRFINIVANANSLDFVTPNSTNYLFLMYLPIEDF